MNDFFYYSFHRLQHASRWLWVQHEIHHSEEHMNVTTSLRLHWSEVIFKLLFISAPMALLFNPPPFTVALAILIYDAPGYFIHLNSRISFGPVGKIFACPQTHRIHHSCESRHFDKNFAGIFSFWDWIFGTYYHPAKNEWPETGLSGKAVPSLPYAVVMPLVAWAGMMKERFENKTEGFAESTSIGD
jgi:sterol desaturase/sphingolipid hydroxylase (fatty acid hydroxylase superfamily)